MSSGQLRASDADRDLVREVLARAYAEGRITADEHSDRTSAVAQARTFDELTPLTADLVAVSPTPSALAATSSGSSSTPARTDGRSERVIAICTSGKRVGPWRVAHSTSAQVVLGDALIDLTEATFDSDTVEINCTQLAGMTKVRVPVGTNVVFETANVLGTSSIKDVGPPDPAMPTVVIRGVNIMGDIQVRGPKKPPPWKRHVT
jgi:hypothetical protein